jgi:hypothetical protein
MTLHGGASGVVSNVGVAIGNALGTAGGESGILGGLADFDDAVASSVKGGWGGLAETAAVMTASYFGGPLGAAAARGAFDYTHGGEDRKNALRNAAEQAAVSYAGQYGGALGAGAAKTGLEYTHGGSDRENALKSGAIAGGTQLAMEGVRDYFADPKAEVPVVDRGDFIPDTPAPNVNLNGNQTVEGFYNDGYTPAPDNPDISPDYRTVPGEIGFNIQPADSYLLGQSPTSYIPTDMPSGTQFEGPNGTEIVAPNGKTYLMKDLQSALLSQPEAVTAPSNATPETLTSISDTSPKTIVQPTDNLNPQVKLDPEEVFKTLSDIPYDSSVFNPADYNAADKEFFKYNTPLTPEQVASNNAFAQKQADMGMTDRLAQMPGATYDMAKSYAFANPPTTAALAYGAYNMLGSKPKPQPESSPNASSAPYTGGYGSAGITSIPYLLRNRVNAQNIYGYNSPISRYADGGEVKHFGVGGIADSLTRLAQPFEKSILQPIGNAAPFLRDAAPYAGLIAAPFIASPAMAAGVGALASGFGKPGSGFNMKRAMMGGIAAYGMSNIGAGVEAAGGGPTTPLDNIGESYAVPGTEVPKTGSTGFFRDTDAMSSGIKNLAGGSTYKPAAAKFLTEAGLPSAGMTVMGTSGVMGIDEAIEQQKAADVAAAATKGENQEMLNRIAAGKKRAEEAVRANPYMYAVGGSVNNEYEMGGDISSMQGNLQNGFMGGMPSYAAGGMPDLALLGLSQPAFNQGAVGGMQQFATGGLPRFLSGGGDGMSDSIPATIEGNQEARLADGEFVIPADVVSHLGNGSSKAGAKQLYSMMDRVRQARVGTKQQGKAIKPKKFMPV